MNDDFGPKPWHQSNWDFRAALNFIFGGAGAGLLVIVAFSGLAGDALRAEIVLGMALIGAGLISVWFEIGRPLRAINVGFNPFTSWMTRESFAAGAVFALGLSAAWLGSQALAQAAALAALVFAYCQGRMLQAAKGIPAWRVPALAWLIFTTALAEGAGLFVVLATLFDTPARGVLAYFSLALDRARAGLVDLPRQRGEKRGASGAGGARPGGKNPDPIRHHRAAGAVAARLVRGRHCAHRAAARRCWRAGDRMAVQVCADHARRLQPGFRIAASAGARHQITRHPVDRAAPRESVQCRIRQSPTRASLR